MSNQLFDAITSSITASMDPNTAVTREYLQSVTKEKLEDVKERQAQTIQRIGLLMAKADEDGAPVEVKQAYAKLLATYS